MADLLSSEVKATLCYIFKGDKVLLLRKAKGLFGEGKWNAPGGRMEKGESPFDTAIREVYEETGLKIEKPELMGVILFYFGREKKEPPNWKVYVFRTEKFEGKLKHSREGKLKWFNIKKLPYDNMWEDDRFWLPVLLSGRKFFARFFFDAKVEKLLNFEIKTLDKSF